MVQDDFQAVILAGYGQSLYALLEDEPKALLPIANKPMLQYALQMTEAAGIHRIFVVAPQEHSQAISNYLTKFYEPLHAETRLDVRAADMDGTADALRHLRDQVTSDFLVLSCDLITNISLLPLLNQFRLNRPTVAMLLSEMPRLDSSTSHADKTKDTPLFVGLDASNERLLFYKSQTDLADAFTVRMPLLNHFPVMNVYTKLRDAHAYVFHRGILDLLQDKKDIVSIRDDLIPLLVRCQSSLPLFKQENLSQYFKPSAYKLTDDSPILTLLPETSATSPVVSREFTYTFDRMSTHTSQRSTPQPTDLSSTDTAAPMHLFTKLPICMVTTPPPRSSTICVRANKLKVYGDLNRYMAKHGASFLANAKDFVQVPSNCEIHPKASFTQDSMIGEGSKVAERAGVVRSVIGAHCSVATLSRISNSVILDYVTIEEGVKLEGCIIGHGAVIKSKTFLKDCNVGPQRTIESGTIAKEEDL